MTSTAGQPLTYHQSKMANFHTRKPFKWLTPNSSYCRRDCKPSPVLFFILVMYYILPNRISQIFSSFERWRHRRLSSHFVRQGQSPLKQRTVNIIIIRNSISCAGSFVCHVCHSNGCNRLNDCRKKYPRINCRDDSLYFLFERRTR